MKPLIPYFEQPSIPIPNPWFPELGIHGFGVLVAIGFWIGTWMATRKARRDGLDPDHPGQLVGWLIVSLFVGGHLFHALFYDWETTRADPMYLLRVWDGLSSSGGLITSVLAGIVFYKLVKKVDFFPSADTVCFGLINGWVFGRLGCFVAHDHPGLEATSFPLAVYGICPNGASTVACHDLGLYEAIWAAVMIPIFWWFDRKPQRPGFFVALICLSYAPFRFLSDFLRHPDTDERLWGLTPAQYFTLALVVIGVGVIVANRKWDPIREA